MFVYHLLWTVGLIFLVPFIGLLRIGQSARSDRLTLGMRLADRLAWRLPDPLPQKGNIWIHALSVGEVVSALPLVSRLRTELPDRDIVFTATTSTGMAIARERLGGTVKVVAPMPMDAWWSVQKMVRFIKPAIFILVETDIWPALPNCLRQKGIPSILVNGRISPRTFRSYGRAPFLVQKMFEPLNKCLMQSDLDRERLLDVGLTKEKVITAGNIKFDRDMPSMSGKERQGWLDILGLEPADPLWVAGSTHPGEEEILFAVFKRLRVSFPRLRLIVAPRDTGRSDEIVTMSRGMGLKAVLKTQVSEPVTGDGASLSAASKNRDYDVLILNTMGELGRIYGLGSVCFVGGSLVQIGGHNLLEPAGFGIPVVFGPHTHNFVSMAQSLLAEGGGRRVQNADELYKTIKSFLKNGEMRTRTGALAKAFVERNRGALERVLNHVKGCVEQGA
ncbi:MAG: 3-deoxy-D-manno-octulosonic acid transferase [Deltaproteobacteria bacterium]|nr:3-deoxy-D-manno-octulosonic acid transferase [Deltaproteobacteria bacterium]